MARNTLENALRWQEHLGNQTTCHSCAVSQALNFNEQQQQQTWICECGEIILQDSILNEAICPKCKKEMEVLHCCTRNK